MNTVTTYRKKIKETERKESENSSNAGSNSPNNTKKSLRWWIIALIVAAVILIIIVVGVFIFKKVGKSGDQPNIPTDNQNSQNENQDNSGNSDNNGNTGNNGNSGNTGNNGNDDNSGNNGNEGNTGNNALSKKEALQAFEPNFKVSSKTNNLNQVLMKSNLKHSSISNEVESTTLSVFTKAKFDLYTLNESYAEEESKEFYSKKFSTVITINSMCTTFSADKTDCELEQYLDLNVKNK
jgi:hypothetical protein